MAPLNTTPVLTTRLLTFGSRSRGGSRRVTLDLTTAYSAIVCIRVGRTGTAVLSAGIQYRINRLIDVVTIAGAGDPYDGGGAFEVNHPAPEVSHVGGVAAALLTSVNADSAAGNIDLHVASSTGFVAGDIIAVGYSQKFEVARVAVVSTGQLELEAPLQFTHLGAGAEPVTNKADVFTDHIDGGSKYQIIVDYSAPTTGDAVNVEILALVYEKDTTV